MHCIIIQTITNYNKRHNPESYEFKDVQQVSPPCSQHKTQNASFALFTTLSLGLFTDNSTPSPCLLSRSIKFDLVHFSRLTPYPLLVSTKVLFFPPQCNIFCPVYTHVFQVSLDGRDVCEARIPIFGKINLIFCYQICHGAALKSSLFI